MRYLAISALLIAQCAAVALSYKAPRYCTTELGSMNYCGQNPGSHPCLVYHPKEEFCDDPKAALPTCCRAADDPKNFAGCLCCRSVYGSKRANSNERIYSHTVEYEVNK